MRGLLHLLVFFSYGWIQAQGSFLPLPMGARQAALGGWNISSADKDVSLAIENPALFDSVEDRSFSLFYSPYVADIHRVGYVMGFKNKTSFPLLLGLVGNRFGTFEDRDVLGNKTGETVVADASVFAGTSYRIGPFSLGVVSKFYTLRFPSVRYQSLNFSMGGHYINRTGEIQVGLLMQQIGLSWGDVDFFSTDISPTAHIGLTVSPKYMPFRFILTVFDVGRSFREGYYISDNSSRVDQVLNYINAGIEFPVGKKIELSGGYNHLRREELRLVEGAFGAGLSLGVLVKTKKWNFRASRMTYHAAGGSFTFSLSSNYTKLLEIY